ncbi:MAG: hotdog fold thioesterase [Bacteroidetes bacterium]|jgi:1,4-dihydroxy-2-naphthoyl-CoA hydrolase|nr:hotdog fold thioesterase [Bacteroidota bacterium]
MNTGIPIWFNKQLKLEDMEAMSPDTMAAHLGMKWVEIGTNYLKMSMPVDGRTKQPYGLLHGGASCVLAETIGSVASHCMIDPSKNYCVGLEINANHIRSVRSGYVTGTATPIHIGATTHVWDIKIHDDAGKLVCVSRLTVAILKRKD